MLWLRWQSLCSLSHLYTIPTCMQILTVRNRQRQDKVGSTPNALMNTWRWKAARPIFFPKPSLMHVCVCAVACLLTLPSSAILNGRERRERGRERERCEMQFFLLHQPAHSYCMSSEQLLTGLHIATVRYNVSSLESGAFFLFYWLLASSANYLTLAQ